MSRPKVEKQAKNRLFLVIFRRFLTHFERVLAPDQEGLGWY
jgi:hypothetical protein